MKLKLLKAVVVGSFVLVSSIVFATKPISPEMEKKYEKEADLIVKGVVESPIKCSFAKTKEYCYKDPSFTAPLKVEKLIKGEKVKGETIQITFCSSGPTSPPTSGERGNYYLKKSSKGDWQLIFSDDVIYAAGALPPCK